MIEFLVENYVIVLTIAILLLMALIGYYAQKSDILKRKGEKSNFENHSNRYSSEFNTFENLNQNIPSMTNGNNINSNLVQNPVYDNQMLNQDAVNQVLSEKSSEIKKEENSELVPIFEPAKIDNTNKKEELYKKQDFEIDSNIPQVTVQTNLNQNSDVLEFSTQKENLAATMPIIENTQLEQKVLTDKQNIVQNEIPINGNQIPDNDIRFEGISKDEPMDYTKVNEYLSTITKNINKKEQNEEQNGLKIDSSFASNSKSFEEIMEKLEQDDNIDEILSKGKNTMVTDKSQISDFNNTYETLGLELELPKINLPKSINDDEIWD